MSMDDTQLASYSYDDVGRISGMNSLTFGYLANSNLFSSVNRPDGVDTAWSYESSRKIRTTMIDDNADGHVLSSHQQTEKKGKMEIEEIKDNLKERGYNTNRSIVLQDIFY